MPDFSSTAETLSSPVEKVGPALTPSIESTMTPAQTFASTIEPLQPGDAINQAAGIDLDNLDESLKPISEAGKAAAEEGEKEGKQKIAEQYDKALQHINGQSDNAQAEKPENKADTPLDKYQKENAERLANGQPLLTNEEIDALDRTKPNESATDHFDIEGWDDLSDVEKQDQLAGKLQKNADNINALQEKMDAETITPEEQAQLDQFKTLNTELYSALKEVDPNATEGEGGLKAPVTTAKHGEVPPEEGIIESSRRDADLDKTDEADTEAENADSSAEPSAAEAATPAPIAGAPLPTIDGASEVTASTDRSPAAAPIDTAAASTEAAEATTSEDPETEAVDTDDAPTPEAGSGAAADAETESPENPERTPDAAAEAVDGSSSSTESGTGKDESPEDNQRRIDEINKEMDEGNFEHEEELDRLVKSSKEKDELQKLQEKKWSELTPEERARRKELEAKSKGETEPNLTPEQEAEKRKQKIEDLGTELMTKLANGGEITSEEEERLQGLMAEQKMTEAGFTPDQARAAAKEALKLSKENASRKTQEAKEKIQELMSLELQLISSRNLAQQLGEKRKEAIEEARKAHDDAENAKPEERMRKKGIEYSKYYAVANITGQIQGMRYTAQRINARRQDLEQQVRWNLGITGPWEALKEWGGAQANNMLTEITILAEEELPLGMGEPLGNLQRGKLAAAGKI